MKHVLRQDDWQSTSARYEETRRSDAFQSTGEDAKLSCVESELKPTEKHPTTASFESFRRTDDACHGGGVP
ncbi:hypothetical protein TNCV_3497171 [Trichonephila clavipes]|nr:hypothetical protein TNCV_3497171 [Trichonephila clavipes]